MGCSSSRTDLVKPQDLLTEASEPSTTKETKDSRDLQVKLLEKQGRDGPVDAAPLPSQLEPVAVEEAQEIGGDDDLPTTEAFHSVGAEDLEGQETKGDLVVDEVEQVEPGVAQPELSWFDAAILGNLPELQLHVKLATTSSSLLESQSEDERKTALHLTAQHGHVEACQWLLSAKADASAITKKKATILHLAATSGHLKVLQLFLDPDLDLDRDGWPTLLAVDLWRCSPLHRAAESGKTEVACYLLKKKADPKKPDREGNSPLHFAASAGCTELVLELLKHEVPLDFANNDGFAPLDLCVRKQQAEVGDVLVKAGAKMVKDVKKTPPSMLLAAASGLPFFCSYVFKSEARNIKKELIALDSEGRTPFLLAVHLGHLSVVQRLISLGSTQLMEVAGTYGRAPVHEAAAMGNIEMLLGLLELNASVEQVDAQGSTALFHAAAAKQTKMLEELLTLGLRPEQCNDSERTALHFAASAGDLDSCRSLLAASTDSKMLLKCQDWEGATAVHLSIKSGHASTCRFLFEATADLQEIMDFGVTPLQVAADLGHSEVLQLLLEDLLHPNQPKEAFQRALQGRQGDGRGAWLVACANGRLACARLLHQAAEKVQIDLLKEEDRNKRKALILAALGGHLEVCKWLVEMGFSVKERDSVAWTPLHAASAEGHLEVVDWLLKQGADVSAVDEDGHTSHSLARRRGCAQVETLLKRYAAQAAGA